MATKAATRDASLSVWQRRKLHTITAPSGQRLRIEILGLAGLLEQGDLPEDLTELALLELTERGGATAALAERLQDAKDRNDQEAHAEAVAALAKYGNLQRRLAIAAIREIELAPDEWEPVSLRLSDLPSLPEDDLAMVAEIVQRFRATDAQGVRIGVEPLDRWATFREVHGCPEDCPHCEELVRRLSSTDVG